MAKKFTIVGLALVALAAVIVVTALALSAENGDGQQQTQPPQVEQSTTAAPSEPAETKEPGAPEGPAAGVTLMTEEHISYIKGNGAGYFDPEGNMTRGEIAVMLNRLLSEKVPVTVSYSDVPANSWYAEAAAQLGSLGVLRAGESTFLGEESLTRGEFAHCIAAFFPMRTDAEQFGDVSPTYRYADDILSCRAYGWLRGYTDGSVRAGQLIQRGEAVALLNRALGRTGDTASITENRPALFLDVPVTSWCYTDVMEATVPHVFADAEDGGETWTSFTPTDTGLPANFRTQGTHLYQGWSYYYNESAKDLLRSTTNNKGFTYDANGHFTSGDPWLDQQLRNIILKQTNETMTSEEMLRALFAHCRDDYKYLKWNTYALGDTSFVLEAAQHFLSTGRGNCYCYAATYWYLCRWLGYDAKVYSGSLPGGPHSWVEIDGYIYDTQLAWRYVHDYGNAQHLWSFYHRAPTAGTLRYRK